ncbi:hypothetical protein OAM82_00075 [Candidatus Thioglobus sp.]|nr:hypothetical protein [Candidatus Thioglobus sp.]
MTVQMWQSFLGWSVVINSTVVILWVLMIKYAYNYTFKMHSYWIPISKESFNAIHYGGIGLYKLAIFMFNLVPYFVLMMIS